MRINLTAKGENQKLVLAYLEENASDVLVEKINSGKKTMDDCWKFIEGKAKDQAKNGCACVRDDVVFGWAIHFFEEDSIKAESKSRDNCSKEQKKEEKEPVKTKPEKKSELDNQISLFDLVGGMV